MHMRSHYCPKWRIHVSVLALGLILALGRFQDGVHAAPTSNAGVLLWGASDIALLTEAVTDANVQPDYCILYNTVTNIFIADVATNPTDGPATFLNETIRNAAMGRFLAGTVVEKRCERSEIDIKWVIGVGKNNQWAVFRVNRRDQAFALERIVIPSAFSNFESSPWMQPPSPPTKPTYEMLVLQFSIIEAAARGEQFLDFLSKARRKRKFHYMDYLINACFSKQDRDGLRKLHEKGILDRTQDPYWDMLQISAEQCGLGDCAQTDSQVYRGLSSSTCPAGGLRLEKDPYRSWRLNCTANQQQIYVIDLSRVSDVIVKPYRSHLNCGPTAKPRITLTEAYLADREYVRLGTNADTLVIYGPPIDPRDYDRALQIQFLGEGTCKVTSEGLVQKDDKEELFTASFRRRGLLAYAFDPLLPVQEAQLEAVTRITSYKTYRGLFSTNPRVIGIRYVVQTMYPTLLTWSPKQEPPKDTYTCKSYGLENSDLTKCDAGDSERRFPFCFSVDCTVSPNAPSDYDLSGLVSPDSFVLRSTLRLPPPSLDPYLHRYSLSLWSIVSHEENWSDHANLKLGPDGSLIFSAAAGGKYGKVALRRILGRPLDYRATSGLLIEMSASEKLDFALAVTLGYSTGGISGATQADSLFHAYEAKPVRVLLGTEKRSWIWIPFEQNQPMKYSLSSTPGEYSTYFPEDKNIEEIKFLFYHTRSISNLTIHSVKYCEKTFIHPDCTHNQNPR